MKKFEHDMMGHDGWDIPVANRLVDRKAFQRSLDDAFAIWRQRDRLTDKIARGGKDLHLALIASLIARTGMDDMGVCHEIAQLGGQFLFNPTVDLIQEFTGTDPERHLWHEVLPGHYALTL